MAETINWAAFTQQAVHGNPPTVGGFHLEWQKVPEAARFVWNHPFATRLRENIIPDLIVGGVTGAAVRVALAGTGGWIAGAVGGAVVSSAVESFRQIRNHQQIDVAKIGFAAVRGAVGGVVGFEVTDLILSQIDLTSFLPKIEIGNPSAGTPESSVQALVQGTPYQFEQPDRLGLTIPSTDISASSAKGAAEWGWFKAHVNEKFGTGLISIDVGENTQVIDLADPTKFDPFNGYHKRLYEMLMEDQLFTVSHDEEINTWIQGLVSLNQDTVIRVSGNDFLIPHRNMAGELLTIQMPTKEWFIQEITKIRAKYV